MAHKASHRPMSIDAMLDMERQEVLALLESKAQETNTSPERVRSKSPYEGGTARSPVRSMLDIPEEPGSTSQTRSGSVSSQRPVRSMLDIDGPALPPARAPPRSMLDVGGPKLPPAHRRDTSAPRLPHSSSSGSVMKSQPLLSSKLHPRSNSDAGLKPATFGARKSSGGADRVAEYQFGGMLPSLSQKLPTRASQSVSGGQRSSQGSSLGEAFRSSGDYASRPLPGAQARHSSIGGRLGGSTSRSPHGRSRSPATFAQNKVLTNDGQIVDFSSAYRRLSDANLAFSSGSLSKLPQKKQPSDPGEGRLIKDYLGPDGEHLESSDEEDEPYSSDDEDRGRTKVPRNLIHPRNDESGSRSRAESKPERKTLSLLAAAEEERKFSISR